jgi:hypothetical protein
MYVLWNNIYPFVGKSWLLFNRKTLHKNNKLIRQLTQLSHEDVC